MRNTGLEEAQARIKIAERTINNLRYADDTTLRAESKEELKSLLTKVKEQSENVGLKLNIQKMKIMASGPITSWQRDGETMETVTDFILGGSKITADGGGVQKCQYWANPPMKKWPLFLHSLEKEMATHSSILAWEIPWTEQPGRLQSMWSRSRTQLKRLSKHFLFIDSGMASQVVLAKSM